MAGGGVYVHVRAHQRKGGRKKKGAKEEEVEGKEKVEKRFIARARGYRDALRLRSHDDDDRARRHESASFTRS